MAEFRRPADDQDPLARLIPVLQRAHTIAKGTEGDVGPRELLLALSDLQPTAVTNSATQLGLDPARLTRVLKEWRVDDLAPECLRSQRPRVTEATQSLLQQVVRSTVGSDIAGSLANALLRPVSCEHPLPIAVPASSSGEATRAVLYQLLLI